MHTTNKCNICRKKILQHKISLFCDTCNSTSHPSCNKLTRSEALAIIQTNNSNCGWTCFKCNTEILPICAHAPIRKTPKSKSNTSTNSITITTKNPGIKCGACEKRTSPTAKLLVCPWCDNSCHSKCMKGTLGCLKCAKCIIPGYEYNARDLFPDHGNNTCIFNPYSDYMHDSQDTEDSNNNEAESEFWNMASECLLNCQYRAPKSIPNSTSTDLKVYSNNIRSLNKNIETMRDDVDFYLKYDVLCFNETSCNPDNSMGGVLDFELEGFYLPIIQCPIRNTVNYALYHTVERGFEDPKSVI